MHLLISGFEIISMIIILTLNDNRMQYEGK